MFTLKNGASPEVRRGKVEGNKTLDYPVGLITADEISAAGGKYFESNTKFYLYKTESYDLWSFSPFQVRRSYVSTLSIEASGTFSFNSVSFANGAASPVINLSAENAGELLGNGTIDNPYRMPA